MSATFNRPRILFVTPEVCFVPAGCRKDSDYRNIKPGGSGGFLSHLIHDLYCLGVDVHITQPDYRNVFSDIFRVSNQPAARKIPGNHVHLTEDRVFFYAKRPQSNDQRENIRISVAFQREVIHQVLPLVQPDLIHCHGWMSGLIPAMAKGWEIPCVFTFQSLETGKSLLAEIEDAGIDAAAFWQHLFFDRFPANYEETRETNLIDFLLSGIFAADQSCIAGSALLAKIGENLVRFPRAPLDQVLSDKMAVGCSACKDDHLTRMQYVDLYEKMLGRPVVRAAVKKAGRNDQRHPYLEVSDLSLGRLMDTQFI
ncbi:MAG: glycogen/starch synthase [Deltaproteobacteria bacterium]|jgi:starch synthase/alpha-amylase|nr:glycogen/starch synthase [Deltaproteobacteria bacterium]MBW2517881.1 glycogen/starch synthase [Deltaproteobacteria bacterium]